MREQIRKPIKQRGPLRGLPGGVRNGWQKVKLYFMCGLPGERTADLDGIVDMAETDRPDRQGRDGPLRGGDGVGVELRPQAAHALPVERHADARVPASRRASICAAACKIRSVKVKQHDIETSMLEGILTRGDRRVAAALEEAWRRGARLDGWSEYFQAATVVADLRRPRHRRRLVLPSAIGR